MTAEPILDAEEAQRLRARRLARIGKWLFPVNRLMAVIASGGR